MLLFCCFIVNNIVMQRIIKNASYSCGFMFINESLIYDNDQDKSSIALTNDGTLNSLNG